MLSKPLLWVAQQAGHGVEVMLRMYAKWLKGSTGEDIEAIKKALEGRKRRAASASRVRSGLDAETSK